MMMLMNEMSPQPSKPTTGVGKLLQPIDAGLVRIDLHEKAMKVTVVEQVRDSFVLLFISSYSSFPLLRGCCT